MGFCPVRCHHCVPGFTKLLPWYASVAYLSKGHIMTAQQKKSGFAALFSRTKKAAAADFAELTDKAEKVAQDAARKAGAIAADVKHDAEKNVAKATKAATKTVKKATTTVKKTAAQAEKKVASTVKKTAAQAEKKVASTTAAAKKAAAPVVSAVKVRTGTPDASWSTAELKEYAKNKGIKGYSSLGKAELLAAAKKAK